MSSLASIASLGSASASSYGVYNEKSSVIRRISFLRSKFRVYEVRVTMPLSCRCSVTATDPTAEKSGTVWVDFTQGKNRDRGDAFLKSGSLPKAKSAGSFCPASRENCKQLLNNSGVEEVDEIKASHSVEDALGNADIATIEYHIDIADQQQSQPEIESKTVPLPTQIKNKVPNPTANMKYRFYNRFWKKGDPLNCPTNVVINTQSQDLSTSGSESVSRTAPLDSVVNGSRGMAAHDIVKKVKVEDQDSDQISIISTPSTSTVLSNIHREIKISRKKMIPTYDGTPSQAVLSEKLETTGKSGNKNLVHVDIGMQNQSTNTPLTQPNPVGGKPVGKPVSSASNKIFQASMGVWRKGDPVNHTPMVVKPKEFLRIKEEGKVSFSKKIPFNESDDTGEISSKKLKSNEMGFDCSTPPPTDLPEMQGKPPQHRKQSIIPWERSSETLLERTSSHDSVREMEITKNESSGEALVAKKSSEYVGVKSLENFPELPVKLFVTEPNSRQSNSLTAISSTSVKRIWRKGDPIKGSPFVVKGTSHSGVLQVVMQRQKGEVTESPSHTFLHNGEDNIRSHTQISSDNNGKGKEACQTSSLMENKSSLDEDSSILKQETSTGLSSEQIFNNGNGSKYEGDNETIKSKARKIKAIKSLGEVLEKLEKLANENTGNNGDKELIQPIERYKISPVIGGKIKPPKKMLIDPSNGGVQARHKEKKPILIDNFAAKMSEFDTLGGVNTDGRAKEKKPILIDNFSLHKSILDPSFSGSVADFKRTSTDTTNEKNDRGGTLSWENGFADSIKTKSAPGIFKRREGSSKSRLKKHKKSKESLTSGLLKAELIEVGEEGMTVDALANNLAINENDVFKFLFSKGIKADGVRHMDKDLVKMLCKEHHVEVIDALPSKPEEMAKKKEFINEDDIDKLESRPPVLTIMGHVDHGKTTLLDYIRKSKVVASEAGGITQGIGAYKVLIPVDGKDQPCVFLDTPGHEAFEAMRARGARVTDIVIIVVAADDGVSPQTNEAIAHAKAAGVPIIFAINKIDKDGASPETTMQQLATLGLMPEAWGGDIPMVKISALRGDNVDELMEIVMLVAELQELKANPHRTAMGTVIEAGLHKSKGPVATFIVQNGTLRKGDVVVCGESFGKVRAMFDDGGNRVNEAGPSMPVQVTGLNHVAMAGDEFEVVGSLDVAGEKAELHAAANRKENISINSRGTKATISSLASVTSAGNLPGLDLHQLNIVMKVDVQGSVEAIRQALQVLPQDNVSLKFLVHATGDVNSSDIDVAIISKAIVLGFNVKASSSVKNFAQSRGIKIHMFKVVYDLIDHVRKEMEALLDPIEEQISIGTAEVLATFSIGSGQVAGCEVTGGRVTKNCLINVLRKGKLIHVGVLHSLRQVKEVVNEVVAGRECGIGIEDYKEWRVGDVVEAFEKFVKRRTLEEAAASMSAAVVELGIK